VPLTPDEQHALRQIKGQLVVYLAGRVSCRRPGIRAFRNVSGCAATDRPGCGGAPPRAYRRGDVAGSRHPGAEPEGSVPPWPRRPSATGEPGVTHNRRIRLDDIDDLAAADRWTRLLVVVWG